MSAGEQHFTTVALLAVTTRAVATVAVVAAHVSAGFSRPLASYDVMLVMAIACVYGVNATVAGT